MKTINKILLTLSLYISSTLAETLTGYYGVATGYYEQKDNFADHSNNHTIYSLGKPKTYDRYLIFPSGDLNYNGFYFKTQFEDDFGVQAGYSWEEGSSVFLTLDGFGVEQTFEEIYSYKLKQVKSDMYTNPYIVNANRVTSEATINSLELKASKLYEFINLEYKYENLSLDDVVANDAKQSGDTHEVSGVAYVIPFSDSIFGGVGAYGGMGDFDGDSNDFIKLGLKYEMKMMLAQKHQVQIKLANAKYDFDTANSYFNGIRDESENSIFVMYLQQSFLENPQLFLNVIYLNQERDSNIDFFDKEMNAVLFNIGYAL